MSVLHLLAFQESKQKLFLKFQDGVFAGQNPLFKSVMSLQTISVWCLHSPCSEHGCIQPSIGCLHKTRNEQMLSPHCSRALACISREARNRYDELHEKHGQAR